MAETYTVKQGDHLARIAEEHGFTDYKTIWNDPNNADLKQKRQNPNVLFPGDQVYIPDKEMREESRPTEKHHKFQVSKQTLQLRLTLEDLYEKPIANTACELIIDQDLHKVTTDGDGKLQLEIPATAQQGFLTIKGPETPFQDETIPIQIGHLDPVEELSGQKARLNNLGYCAGDVAGKADDDFESAVEEFQCDNALTVDGICGPATQSKLKKVHGC